MNIREELNKLDQNTFNQYDLFNLYSSITVDKELKEQVVSLIKESKCEELCKLLSEAYEKQTGVTLTEEAYDNLPEIEDKVKGVTDQVTAKAVKDHERKQKNIKKGLKAADAEIKDEPFTSGENQPKPDKPIVPDLIKEDLDMGADRPFEELDTIAMGYYDNHDEESFNSFSDGELAVLWANCAITNANPWGQPYDDEVYEAIYKRPNKQEIFDKAREIAVGFNAQEDLDEAITNKEIDAAQYAYGFNKKQAREYLKKADDNTKKELVKGFEDNAKKSFLTDSLEENTEPNEKTVDTGHYALWDEEPYTKEQLLYELNSDKMLEKSKGSFQVGHPDERDICAEILSDAGYEYEISGDGPWFHFEYWKEKNESLSDDNTSHDFGLFVYLNTAGRERREIESADLEDFIVEYPKSEEEFFEIITDELELADWEDINTEKDLTAFLENQDYDFGDPIIYKAIWKGNTIYDDSEYFETLKDELWDNPSKVDVDESLNENIDRALLTELDRFVEGIVNNTEHNWGIKDIIEAFKIMFPNVDIRVDESLDENDFSDFNSEFYNKVADILFKYHLKGKDIEREDVEKAYSFFDSHFYDSDDNPGIEE